MPVGIKEYLDSMKTVSSSVNTQVKSKTQSDLKTQQLLSQLIEAISYANSMKFSKKDLKATAKGPNSDGLTNKQVLELLKNQEKLIQQLAQGQKLSNQQSKELNQAIDRFYDAAGAQEINYKKFAASMEKFALAGNLPDAVQTRLINDSRDAHIIGKEQQDKQGGLVTIVKKIRNLLEDSAENTKQFGKKLFVTLDKFREDFLKGLSNMVDELTSFDWLNNILKKVGEAGAALGMLGMAFGDMFKQGNFKWGTLLKQAFNIKSMFTAFKEIGMMKGLKQSFDGMKGMLSGLKSLGKSISNIPKMLAKFGLGKGSAIAAKSIGKNLAKSLGKNVLKRIPGVGLLISLWMAKERFNRKDYVGGLIELGSGFASLFPGVGTAISIALDLINLGKDNVFKEDGSQNKPFKPEKGKFKWPWQKGDNGGDAPINWQNESGNYSPKGLVQSAKNAAKNFNKLIGGGLVVTSAFRDPAKMMPLWNSARPIPGSRNRINKYGNEMADPRRSNHARGLAIDVPMSLYRNLGANRFTKLAKQAGFSLVYPEHSAVHLEVAKSGKVKEDTNASATVTANASALEPIAEDSQAIANYGETTEFEGILEPFNKLSQDIMKDMMGGLQPVLASAIGQDSLQSPSLESIVSGTPSSVTASTSKDAANKLSSVVNDNSVKQAPKQTIQTTQAPSNPDSIDTEIRDTDLALLNSLLFQT